MDMLYFSLILAKTHDLDMKIEGVPCFVLVIFQPLFLKYIYHQ